MAPSASRDRLTIAGRLSSWSGALLLGVALTTGWSELGTLPFALGPATVCQALLLVRSSRHGTARYDQRDRGMAPFAFGLLVAGLSAGVAGGWARLDPTAALGRVPVPTGIALLALAGSTGAFLVGLIRIPGRRLGPLGWLRRSLDGIGMSVCGFFVSWMLLFSLDGIRLTALIGVLLSCTAFCGMVIAGLRSAAGRRAALACGSGIALAIAGLAQLVVALEYHDPPNRVVAAGWALLASPVLVRRAVSAGPDPAAPAEPTGDGDFGDYPLYALPLAAALLAWMYHFVQGRAFDSTAIALALVAVVAVTLRGAVASVDARSLAGRLSRREAHIRSLFAGSTDVIMIVDGALRVSWQSPAAARQLGLSDQDVTGRPFVALVHEDDHRTVLETLAAIGADRPRTAPAEIRLLDGHGAWRPVEWSATDQRDNPAVGAVVVHLRDVSDRSRLQRRMRWMTMVDHVTGLGNRQVLLRALADHDAARGGGATLIVVEVTGLAGLHRVRNRRVGDAVLAEVAYRIRHTAVGEDLPVCLDRGRFAVLTPVAGVPAQFLAVRLLTALGAPYPLPDQPAHLSACAGLADVVPGVDAEVVLDRAELAVHQAASTRVGLVWYDPAVESAARRQLMIEQALPEALAASGPDLLYQPIVDLRTLTPVGVQAVPRWWHPLLGMIGGAEYTPVAERFGLAETIEDRVLQRACHDLAGWLRAGHELWLAVDTTAARVAAPAFLPAVADALDRNRLAASRLVVAVSTAAPDPDAGPGAIAEQLDSLRSAGVSVALDHFGATSTSLAHLWMMPIDLVRVDRSLLRARPWRPGPVPTAIDAVTRLGERLGTRVIVQDVETDADLETAHAAGCHLGQGTRLCPPMPAEHLEAYLARYRTAGGR